MTNHPEDELQRRRLEREREGMADRPATTDAAPDSAEQRAAIARARESFDLSRLGADPPAPDDRSIEDVQAGNRA
jgi:hypothetical protein